MVIQQLLFPLEALHYALISIKYTLNQYIAVRCSMQVSFYHFF